MKVIKQNTFKFLDIEYIIEYVDQIPDENNKIIYCKIDYSECKILISTKLNGNDIPLITQERTLYHELFHLILDEGQYNDCSTDEPLIECLAKGLYELVNKTNLIK